MACNCSKSGNRNVYKKNKQIDSNEKKADAERHIGRSFLVYDKDKNEAYKELFFALSILVLPSLLWNYFYNA